MIYILIGLLVELGIEFYFLMSKDSLVSLMAEVLQEDKHTELRKHWSVKELHFIFAGSIIVFWPAYLLILLVKP